MSTYQDRQAIETTPGGRIYMRTVRNIDRDRDPWRGTVTYGGREVAVEYVGFSYWRIVDPPRFRPGPAR